MPADASEMKNADTPIGTNPRNLVQPKLDLIPTWETSLGERNAFRVRGLSWFRANILRDIDKLKAQIADMEVIRTGRELWTTTDLNWKESFSITQVYSAHKSKALKFTKAAKVLLLCELAAERSGIPATVLYGHMRIEPALFGLADFTAEKLQAAQTHTENILAILRAGAAQTTEKVFWDMAEGKAVSYRLAWRTREMLQKAAIPGIDWGEVIILPDRQKRPRFEVTGREEVEGASVPLDAPQTFGASSP